MLTFRQFLDVSYTLLVDEFIRQGMDMEQALETSSEWSAGGKREPEASVPDVTAIDNDKSLRQLELMMAGVNVR